jgi:Carboxypeptidase regulatory-like domain
MRKPFVRSAFAVLALLVMLVQGTWVLAGTTGGLSGTVTDAQTGRVVAGAKVTVASPGQSATATADAGGKYTFVSLAPDTYTVTVTSPGYAPYSQAGVTVVSDQTLTVNFTPTKSLTQIGRTVSRSSTDLVKPGQTADVYSISGQLSQNSQALGGTTLFQTFAALASVPGVYVPQGTTFGQNTAGPYIRGGDYSQVGFEYDGIPVNRAFDNYVSNTQGITGQQELQVYTGGVSASSAGQGLSGYINQVIKSGTYPVTANTEGVIGAKAFYHYLRGEIGGASPNRNFSYYIGTTGWNQGFRYADPFDGGLTGPNDLTLFGFGNFNTNGAGAFSDKGGITLVPYVSGGVPYISTRENIGNFHIGIPHHNGDGGRDDIQILASVGRQFFTTYDSFNNYGGYGSKILIDADGGTGGPFQYAASQVLNQRLFTPFNYGSVSNYYIATQPQGCKPAGAVAGIILNAPTPCNMDPNLQGREDNNNGLFKLQYQKNIGSSAYIRFYGYSNYSAWLISDSTALQAPFTSVGSLEYQLSTHTRGGSFEFADQINSKNLITGSAAYTFAQSLRANQYSFRANTGTRTWRAQLVDPNGVCYTNAGLVGNCYGASVGGIRRTGGITAYNYNGTLPAVVGAAAAAGAQWVVTQTGFNDVLNQVSPKFANLSLTDQIQFSDKLKVDIGARYNSYVYSLSDTGQQAVTGGANDLLFSQFNREHCFNPSTRNITLSTAASGFTCGAGLQHTDLSNNYPGNVIGNSFEPRISGTYTFNPYSVLRFSAGKYSQPINSAYTQYNVAGGGNSTIGSDLPGYTAANFFKYGFTTPRHDARPQISFNYDMSFEQRLKNAPLTFSVTPFFRRTQDQSQSFFLDPTANFVSGLNVGTLRAYGAEFLGRYGDFNRDGFSGQVAFAYTNSKLKYNNFKGTSLNIIDNINSQLVGYNGLTASGGGSPCYVDANGPGATPGNPAALVGGACPAGTIANPYFNNPQVGFLDRNAYYSPYDLAPAAAAGLFAVGSSTSYEVPYTTTVIVQYRKNGWRFVPTFQYDSGFTYGSPFTWIGYDPSQGACTQADTSICTASGATVFRPNPYTGSFDKLGQFKSPGQLTISMQVQKDFSRHLTGTAILTNIFRHCFTRGYAWEQGGSQACNYFTQTPYVAGGTYLGNSTSPSGQYRVQNDPFGYSPGNTGIPFNAYMSLQWKL